MAPLQAIFHDPQAAPPLSTSPEALGFVESPLKDTQTSPSSRRVKRLSSAVEKTVDKLGRSISGRSSPGSPPGHRRLFSLSRKGKAREPSADRVDGTYLALVEMDVIDCPCRHAFYCQYTFSLSSNVPNETHRRFPFHYPALAAAR